MGGFSWPIPGFALASGSCLVLVGALAAYIAKRRNVNNTLDIKCPVTGCQYSTGNKSAEIVLELLKIHGNAAHPSPPQEMGPGGPLSANLMQLDRLIPLKPK